MVDGAQAAELGGGSARLGGEASDGPDRGPRGGRGARDGRRGRRGGRLKIR